MTSSPSPSPSNNSPTGCCCSFCATFVQSFRNSSYSVHRLLQPDSGRVQVGVGRLDVRVAEQLLDVMNRHSAFADRRRKRRPARYATF